MAFSPWTLLGQSLGGGFNQGFQNQLGFQNTLNRADQLQKLSPVDRKGNPTVGKLDLALMLLGGSRQGGDPLNAILAQFVAQKLGLGNSLGATATQTNDGEFSEDITSGVNPAENLPRSNSGTNAIIDADFIKSTPPGQIPVKDRATGDLGYILPNEFNPKNYIKMK